MSNTSAAVTARPKSPVSGREEAGGSADSPPGTTSAGPAPGKSSGAGSSWLAPSGRLMAAYVVVTVVLLAAAVTLGVLWGRQHAQDVAGQDAVTAARDTATNLVSVSAPTADRDVQRVLDGAVGDFGNLFKQNLDSYVGIVRQGQVQATGTVTGAGLESLDGRTAKVMIAMKSTVKNVQVPQGEDRAYRMVVEVQQQPDGRWLASQVEFAP